MKKCLTVMILFSCILFTGCGPSASVNSQASTDFIGFVTQLENNQVLINDVWFSFDQQTVMLTDQDKKLHKEDIKMGKKVNVTFNGEMQESYPRRASADQMVFLTDKESKIEETVVNLVMSDPRFSQVVIQSIEKNPTGLYSLRFKDLSLDRDVHVMVNVENERVIVPIHTSTK
ncbi:YobA family protein [Rossellomorea vietnamensis]|uniref:YobA family protein n=1 Tax=Rossellomorea vietnamensis TaxID=218284 RepID=A0ACD4C7H9_9BACI|nr:YobA family protein [Rossellomorea vietnamensis]UXH44553.1 YobA family protein [Rossellomorea vietnamensis]WQI95896.1 YobA family protein [Rossellomorea vietnamensis]